MNPSRLFILRPVATSLLMIAIMLAGVVAYNFLPISALPEVDYPTIQIQTFYSGASAEVMTTSVTAPLERQLGQMPSLEEMSSSSSAGASIITLRFSLNLNLDIAEQEVQAAINAANNLLPSDLPAPPIYAKVNPADAPVLTLALTSKTLPLPEVADIADTRLAQKMSQIPGVGLVQVSTGHRPSVRIQAKLQALAAYGLNIDDLRTTISNLNVNTPKGNFDGPSQSYTINANDQLHDPQEYMDSIVAYKNGRPVRMRDVADVAETAENTKLGSWVNTTPAIILEVQRQPSANVISVVDNIKALLPTLEATLPAAVQVSVLSDRTVTIRASVKDVEFELCLAVVLVVLVVFLFLRNLRATIIPSLSVPLSLIGTLSAMYLLKFNLDNLSLMAFTIATGFVVDDAIVVIENISRYIEMGDSPLEAALKGSKQIGFTIVSLTISLIAVHFPLLFMSDVIGRLFHEFSVTSVVTIVLSAIISLTLVPMMCAKMLRHHKPTGGFERLSEQSVRAMIRQYGRMLSWVLRHQALTLVVALGTLVLTVWLYIIVPKGFFPVQDTGLIAGVTQSAQSTSYSAMVRRQSALAEKILKDADVVNLSSFVGVDGTNTTVSNGRFLISLKPHDERQLTSQEIARRIGQEVQGVEGITLFLQPIQDLTTDTTVSATQYQFVLEDANLNQLNTWVPKLVTQLQGIPEITDLASDLQQSGLTADIVIDRKSAARFGVTIATVDNALYDAFGQRIASTIFTQSNQYRVILEAAPNLQGGLDSLGSIYLPSSSVPTSTTSGAGQVPLSAISTVSVRNTPLRIEHLGQFPAATISFNLAPGASLGDAVSKIRQTQQAIKLPDGFIANFRGATSAFESSLNNEIFLLIAAIVTMYIILGVLYESFIHPITILSTLPSAGVGALLALMFTGFGLDIMGIVGILLLIGIVKKNAIMMVDFALEAEREHGKSPQDAIYEACLLRFRPILMTTLAALFGALPLMLGTGTGSELRRPLGISIVGGLLLSQVLTLFTTPVIYLALDRLGRRISPRISTEEQ
ncbi:MAG: multidrug efflux RND transporter permease subunit [Verrucomicrobia bacterium]|nr:multidrug efflux RND transporter permease subunit [Verrucomicrobiota bacterium]